MLCDREKILMSRIISDLTSEKMRDKIIPLLDFNPAEEGIQIKVADKIIDKLKREVYKTRQI